MRKKMYITLLTINIICLSAVLYIFTYLMQKESGEIMPYNIYGEFISSAINAKAKGLYGDGVHDDADKLNEILSNYKRVYLPSGTYLISKTIVVPNGTMLFGDGLDTIIQLADSYTLTGIAWRQDYKYPYLILYGNTVLKSILVNGDETASADQGQVGVMAHGDNISIENVKTNNTNYFPEDWIGGTSGYGTVNAPGYGISVLNSSNVFVRDCVANGNGYEGIGIESSNFVTLEGCSVGDGNRTGIQIHRYSKNVLVSNCIVDNRNEYATADITVHGESDDYINNLEIASCKIVSVHNASQSGAIHTVTGAEENVYIHNCHINAHSSGITTSRYDQSSELSRKYIITDNIINSDGKGIELYGNEAIISNNIITAGDMPIYMSGQDSVIENNLILSSN